MLPGVTLNATAQEEALPAAAHADVGMSSRQRVNEKTLLPVRVQWQRRSGLQSRSSKAVPTCCSSCSCACCCPSCRA